MRPRFCEASLTKVDTFIERVNEVTADDSFSVGPPRGAKSALDRSGRKIYYVCGWKPSSSGETVTKAVGTWLPLSPFRRVVTDLMHFSRQVPAVAADRRMDLSPLHAARRACASTPSWTVLFSKAYGLLCRDYPELRRSYLKFPWPHLYEHPHTVAEFERKVLLGLVALVKHFHSAIARNPGRQMHDEVSFA